ncbi:glycosyl transferase [Thermoplasma volcanium GSS1]|uniref:Glycosyl transferase n=1 Tax=Thermoplasma volcanium (strain ATCC 51530 / DSM 4299 / JCM 9571 / NBRC 15438 / GSS1) TaxID=273116 RepID=Q97BD4_THEVO|nr:glycosyltransferase [Thermoplasma volcanium]BAB59664.1 glycosyl transferase [Thermoplasma volcanium GSS1]
MKIAYFSDTYYPTPDGVSTYLKDVKRGLEKRGHEVYIFSLTGDPHEKNVFIPRTVPFPPYDQYRMPLIPFPFREFKTAVDIMPDVIHLHNAFYMSSVGYLVARRLGKKPISTFHTDIDKMRESIRLPFSDLIFDLGKRYSIYLYRKCKFVLAPSCQVKAYLERCGLKNIVTVPLFVDTDELSPAKASNKQDIILYLGRLTKDKGVYRVLELANEMKGTGYKFIIAGVGPELERMKAYVKENDISNVNILGYVKEDEKKQLMEVSKFFIYPSSADTFGISVFEALSMGLPAIVSKEFPVKEDTNAIVYEDFSNIKHIANKLLNIDQATYSEMSTSARTLAISKYSIDRHIDQLLSLYMSLVDH